MHAEIPPPVADPKDKPGLPWWRELTRYHWFVFLVASLGWLFDCLDQQLFILARDPAITALLPAGTRSDVIKEWGGIATSIFVVGWATGGLIFGAVGDRIGRARTLTLTVLLYSVSTGLSAFSVGVLDFSLYRFLTGLGVGGVFGLAVALLADALPDRPRPQALGLLQALSAAGNISAGLIAILVGWLEIGAFQPGSAWKYLFLIGALPAFLSVFIALRVREPEKWVRAREEGRATGVAFGSYASLFGTPRWRRAAILGMLLCVAGVVGLWGVGFFSPSLVSDVINKLLRAENVPAPEVPGRVLMWTGVNMVMQNLGAFLGMMAFTWAAHHYGRKPVFAVGFVAAFLSTVMVFRLLSQPWHIFVLSPIMGFCQLSVFAGFAIYLPELFPLRLRSTGTSFCYNVGRFLAASGPLTLGVLQRHLADGATTADARLEAFRSAACWLSLVYLLGILVLPFLPETRGRPLPE
jgi:MFS family permease